jgi:glycosyltransferase involved in cell wall biosynthesis
LTFPTVPASVIVRVKDEARTLEHCLELLRSQTVEPEIIVVDSGSTDGSLEIARRYSENVILIPPEEFTYGRTLNVGARAAVADFHFAISAHCYAERPDWIERSLKHYARPDVAATNGIQSFADGRPVTEPFFQDAAHARSNPFWGISNHASSWRRSVWQQFPFSEEVDYAEDREWALRVLDAGWKIVFDPELWVDLSHRWRGGARELFRRERRAARAVCSFAELPPYRRRDLAREWWREIPPDGHSALLHRLNYVRIAGLAGKYVGAKEARSS